MNVMGSIKLLSLTQISDKLIINSIKEGTWGRARDTTQHQWESKNCLQSMQEWISKTETAAAKEKKEKKNHLVDAKNNLL